MLNFAEGGYPIFRATSALERGEFEKQSKRKEVCSLQRKWRNRLIDSSNNYFCQSVNGVNKYVTETSEEIPTENVDLFISTRKLVAKAKPRPKPLVNVSSTPVPINVRTWIDIGTQPFDHICFEVSKFMTRALRHEASIPREIGGAVKFDDLIEKLKIKFAGTLQWTVSTWVNSLAKRRRTKEKVSNSVWTLTLPSTSCISDHFKDIQEVTSLVLHCKTMYCYWRTSQSTSITLEM